MRAIFIAVGSELLEQDKVDTNSLYIARRLMEKGILMDMKAVVADDINNLSWMIKSAYKRAQVVILTGGLGPTEDDITREAVADALKRDLEFDETIMEELRQRYQRRGQEMPDINTRQAFVIQGAEVLPNPLGSAPGLYIDDEECKVLLLPGPPHEMKPMFDAVFEERVAPLSNFFVYKRCFKFAGLGESKVDSMLAELYNKYKRNVKTTVLSNPYYIEVHLSGRSRKTIEEAKILTDELAEKIKERMGDHLVTEEDISFEQFIVDRLRDRGLTLAVAESCTGGGLGRTITRIPGSSDVFLGGVIAYADDIKKKLLGVSETTLEKKGAVSKETAEEMAIGVRERTGADIGIAITGIAGPSASDTPKPVGLVFMHLSTADKEFGLHQLFPGTRGMVRARAVNFCLNLIREHLKD